jgi:hypothetical protein
MERSEAKKILKEIHKKIDDMENNQLTHLTDYQFQALRNMPKAFKEFGRDKKKDLDPGKAFLNKPKRKRKRHVTSMPERLTAQNPNK